MSSDPPESPIINLCDEAHKAMRVVGDMPNGIAAINSLSERREKGNALSAPELIDAAEAIRQFLASPNNNAKPGKDVLFEAVRSLVAGPRKLSRRWDKTQLSLVLLRWMQDAICFSNPDLQQHLTIKILSNAKKTKQLKPIKLLPSAATTWLVHLAVVLDSEQSRL